MSHTYRHADWEPLERARRVDRAKDTEAQKRRLRRRARSTTNAVIVGRQYRTAGESPMEG